MDKHIFDVKNVYKFCISRFNLEMPIYVNMVRDPVERVISWYYYVRAPWYFVERKRAFPDLPLLVLDAGFLPLGVAPFLPPALLDLGADFLEPKAGFLAEIFLPAEAPLETFFPALAS